MTVWWVDGTNGNDSTGNGSRASPYATIERALTVFRNTDQIRILDGTYTPTDSIVISGLEGSIFAETPQGVHIQPQRTRRHQAGLAVLDAARFALYGVNVLQAADNTGNLIGIFVDNVDTFLALTCSVDDFDVPSGSAHGIFARGTAGRIQDCRVTNINCAGGSMFGIRSQGLRVVDCTVYNLSGTPDTTVIPIEMDGQRL